MRTKLILLFTAAFITACAAMPGQRSELRGPVTEVEGISEYTLDNGMRVLLFPDPTRPTTTVNVTYFVGSRHEGYGETGMAHLLEHLVFKGTPDHPNISDEITERGGRANGTTWFDRTNYFQTFPATEDNIEWSLGMEADRMVNSFISAEDLESEMTVVRNEWEAGENSPFSVLFKRTLAAAFQWHGYGRSTIGERSDIENVPIERLQDFYRRYYQPDNAILIVSGSFDEDHVHGVIEDTFGRIPRPERTGEMVLYDTYTREPTQDGERSITLRRVGDVQYAMAIYKVPAAAHEDYAAVHLLTHILADEPSGRLHKALVETGKASSVSAFAFALREPGVLILAAEVGMDQSLDEASEIMLETIEGLRAEPPTEAEVERARTAKLRDMRLMLNDSNRIGIGLSEWAASGDWRLVFIHRDRLREITPDAVAQAASDYLISSNRTFGRFIPDREPVRARIPEAPAIAELVEGYEGDETAAVAEAFDASIPNIEARTIRHELPGGAEVALLPKSTRGESVVATITLRLGDEERLTGRATAGSMAASMLMRGTEHRTRQELNDEFDRLQANVSVGGGAMTVNVRVETVREHLLEVLELVGEVLREPAFDAREFEELRRSRLTALESQRSEPQPRGIRAFSRHMQPWAPGHPHYTPDFDEQIALVEGVELDEVRAFHTMFYGAGPGTTAAVVGDFDTAEVQQALARAIGDWPMQQPFERVANPYHEAEPADIEIETPDKTNAFLVGGLNLELRDDHPDYPAMVLANYILGGGFLNSRLATRVRQQEGLSYGIGSQFSAHPIDERGSFLVFAIFAPENSGRVETAIREELERAIEDGFTAEEVEAAKRGWLQSREVSRGTDRQLVGMLSSRLYFDRTFLHDAGLEDRVRALQPDDLVGALRRHVDLDALVTVRAGDFGTP